MRKARIIAGLISIGIVGTVCYLVCKQWALQGCGVQSLLAALGFYIAIGAGVWGTVDSWIKELKND